MVICDPKKRRLHWDRGLKQEDKEDVEHIRVKEMIEKQISGDLNQELSKIIKTKQSDNFKADSDERLNA